METFTTKLGTAKGTPRARIWIEGDRLKRAGFAVGVRYHRTAFQNALRLQIHPEGRLKVSGKGDHPIIDITGNVVTERFTGECVVVEYLQDLIEIKNP